MNLGVKRIFDSLFEDYPLLKSCADSASSTPKIQELHLPIYHAWCAMLEAHFFPSEEA